jgi:DNA-binding SARP family transcriptional activator
MSEQFSIAKITKPSVSGVYQRERLVHLLDEGLRRPLVWVSGPAGSGKTTLVSSYLDARKLPCLWYLLDEGDSDPATFFYYLGAAATKPAALDQKPLPLLTPEYLQGIPIFTKRFFERLCEGLKPPFALVFDNYQDVPENSMFHDMIVHGLEAIPEGITIILVSRKEPPPPFARLRANNKMAFAGWDEIRSTLDESREIVRIHGGSSLTDASLEELYRKTQGWMAGLVLLMEGAKGANIDQAAISKLTTETIFDYFASEIFEKTESTIQEFLLKTSLLPSLTATMAEKLTHIKTSEQVLSRLYKNHYFIEMRAQHDPVYHYHPLFREFLLSKVKSLYAREEISAILQNAAALLEESGHVEHAALLLRNADDRQGLVALVLRHAESLHKQGRGRTILDWIESLPENIVNVTPWLLYWMGICKIPYSFTESRAYLERSFNIFKRRKEAAGIYLSWAGIINTYAYEFGDFAPLDRWVTEMEAQLLEYPEFPSREIEAWVTYGMFTALAYRQPHHPDLPAWEQRLIETVLSIKDAKLKTAISSPLLIYNAWMTGDLEKVSFLINTLKSTSNSREADPMSYIVWRSFEAGYYWMTASYEACLKAVNDGLKASEETGIHVWDFMCYLIGAMINMTSGNPERAQIFLDKMSAVMNPNAYAIDGFYYSMSMLAYRLRGDVRSALEYAKACYDHTFKSGMPWGIAMGSFVLGTALLDNNESEKGLAHLADAQRSAYHIKSNTAAYLSNISKAEYFLRRNVEKAGMDALAKTMAIGRQQGFVNNLVWRPALMSFLCAKALAAGIEVDYVQDLIRRRNLVPDASSVHVENWPWPVRIYALGQFRIEKDGKPLAFTGKVQKKPLELLKTLITLGCREVSESKVVDALWPEAEGDAAYRAFITTLQRLRKLLGRKEAVQLQNGCLSLDPRYCWTDTRAFDHVLKRADDAWKAEEKQKAITFYERALSLYKGPLLGREFGERGDITLRDSLKQKFMRCLKMLGQDAELAGAREKAIMYYCRALEVDDRTEEIYRLLMACYAKADRYREAVDIHDRCRKMLSANFGAKPSSETEAIYQVLQKNIISFTLKGNKTKHCRITKPNL